MDSDFNDTKTIKNNVNVVTSYYNDLHKLDWDNLVYSKNYNLFLYKKDNTLKIGNTIDTKNKIIIPNYGRCDYAFLHYIINNYNNLSDYTIFTKINWKEQGINFPKLLDECIKYDYYEVGCGLQSYVWYNNNNLHLKKDEANFYINVDYPYLTEIGESLDIENFKVWYNYIFSDVDHVPGKIFAFDHGPCFSVSKNLIRRHPIEIYQYLMERFHPDSKSWNLNKISIENVGHHYHNHFLRFYKILFTHNVENIYKIYYD